MKIKYNKKINIIILIIFTLLVLYFSLKDDFNAIVNQILTMNVWFLLIAFILLFIYFILRAYSMYTFCKKINNNFKFRESLQLILRTQFFNAITPFATGGQPYQLYYLKNSGIDYAKSTSIVLENFIVYQIALVTLGLFALVLNNIFNIFDKVVFIPRLIALGFVINALVIIIMFLVSFSKKFNKIIIDFGINLLTKLKIVKKRKETLNKWHDNINKFHNSAKILLEDKKTFFVNIIYNFLGLCCLYLIPLFIMFSMNDFNSFNGYESIITCAYIMIIGSFIPIPGATGGLEYGFITFFGNFITGSKLQAMMLVWRFITYYFTMIIGAVALNIKKVK